MSDANKVIPVMKIIKWVMAIGMALLGGAKLYEAGQYVNDNVYEEILEGALEDGLEETLSMPNGTLDDSIDLTPGDKCDNDC